MPFIILLLIIAASLMFYFHIQHKNKKRRECAYGCIKAYDILKYPNRYDHLQSLFSTLTRADERYFYAVSISRNMFPQALKRWAQDDPDSGDAWLCYGARLLQWSWSARGYGRGHEVSNEEWQEFFRRLDMTRDALLTSAEKSPNDPTPWSFLIMVATWYSDSEETKYSYFENAITRDPYNWSAHMHMIIALSEKWGGSNDDMLAFARKASANAPVGSDLKAIVVKAYIEYWKYLLIFEDKPDDAQRFIDDSHIRSDIVEAYNHSIAHQDFVESKVTLFARYNLSGWFWIVRDKTRLKTELHALGNTLEDIHWRWVCTEGELSQAWDFIR